MIQLTSSRNPVLQQIRRAASAGRPTPEGLLVAEGPHLLEEAIRSEWRIEQVLFTPETRDRNSALLSSVDAELVEVSARAFQATASTETAQGILSLLRPRAWTWEDLMRDPPLLAVLDALQDPGNAGAIVRSAEAFGATGVVFLKGSVRVANGKLLRATAGSMFRIPFLEEITVTSFLAHSREHGLELFGLAPAGGSSLRNVNLRPGCALIVGNEGAGLSPDLQSECRILAIPTTRVESLNAAIACSIALFAAHEQRNPL